MEKIQMLEEKVTKVIEKIRFLTDENDTLKSKISELEGKLKNRSDELTANKKELKNIEALKTNIDKLNNERNTVKSQVENLIRELDSVEL